MLLGLTLAAFCTAALTVAAARVRTMMTMSIKTPSPGTGRRAP